MKMSYELMFYHFALVYLLRYLKCVQIISSKFFKDNLEGTHLLLSTETHLWLWYQTIWAERIFKKIKYLCSSP